MLRPAWPARRLALTLTTAVALGVAFALVPVPAHAAVTLAGAVNLVDTEFSEDGSATCSVSNPDDDDAQAFTTNGVTSTRTVSSSSTITDTGDGTDVTTATASATSKVRATKLGGGLQLNWQASAKAQLEAALGPATDCDAEAEGQAFIQVAVNLTENMWASIDAEVPGDSLIQAQIISLSGAPAQDVVSLYGNKARAHVEMLLPQGDYFLILILGAFADAPEDPSDPNPASMTASGKAQLTLTPAGTATGKAAGPGGKYLKLKSARACASDSLQAKWKSAAGQGANRKVDKATFYANGHKVKTVNHPNKGQQVKLKHLVDSQEITVKAKLKLVDGTTQTVSRTYTSCS